MFNALSKLLKSGDTITVTLALVEPGKFRLTVHPRFTGASEDTGKVINKPFAIEGTADELDVEFVPALGGFATTVHSAREVFAGIEKDLKAHEDTKRTAATAKKTAPATPAKPAAKAPPPKAPAKPAPKPAVSKPAAPPPAKPPVTPAPAPAAPAPTGLAALKAAAATKPPEPAPTAQPDLLI